MNILNYKEYRILLVDDEIGNLENMLFALELSFDIITAASGSEALEILAREKIAVIVSDQRMPQMNGAELLSQVKETYPHIIRILITAYSDIDAAVMAINKGDIFRYIKKDNPISEIESYIRQAIDFYQIRDENDQLYEELNQGTMQTITALAKTIDAKDAYTFGHSERVASYGVGIAEIMGFSAIEQDLIRVGGLLHDIGKIGILDDILKKPGRLTKSEFDEIKRHPLVSSKIIESIPRLRAIANIVLTHHERCDGKGYPNGITFGEQATGMDLQEVSTDFARMASWILPVSDTYDAMTSPRPYRDALPTQTALDELNRCKGGQFVPEVVEAFLKFYQKNKEKFIPVKSIIDYTKYPVLLLGENREQLQTIKDVLGKNFTIEIASDIESAKEMLARDNTIRLTLVVQQISGMIDQEMISELLANRFPLTKIALKFAEAHSDWDELINQFQVIKHTFNSASPQILKAEIRKGIEEAMLKEGQEDAATRATQ
jgi:response regulator RpfG family c-di-GMP phosphodiesterase